MASTLSFPIIDMGLLRGEERPAAMNLLHDACQNWGFFQGSGPRHLDGADGRGGEDDQGALQEGARAEVPRVRQQDAAGRRQGGGEPGLGEHLLRAPPPGAQHRRDTRPRRRVPAGDEAVRGGAGEAGGAAAGPALREPRPRERVPHAGVPGLQGRPHLRHQGQQLPAVPAPRPRQGPPRPHRRRRHHPALPGRPRRRPPAAQGRRVGGCAAHAPLHRRQPGRPAGGDHQRQVQERAPPRGRAGRRQPDVHRLLLQPGQRRGDLPGAGAGGGGRRGVPQVRVRGLHEAVRAPQVRGQGAEVRSLQVHGEPDLQPHRYCIEF
uniref:Non-haem dioxygenase N-terminal domain-containing protein n=1 Tax=Aegilops tauschii subsp. strangulata TaxID=200361 RepID=A0A453KYK9_AEGTS